MSLRIAVIAHCRHPIAAPFMGGMEAHAHHLCHALAARGHEVTLVAAGDSQVGVAQMPMMEAHYDRDFPWHRFHGTDALNAHLDRCHAEALHGIMGAGFDVIHNNSLHRFPPRLARAARLPMVSSMHVPPFDALRRAIRDSVAPWHCVTGCSTRHLRAYFPDALPGSAHVVPNGIDVAEWPFRPEGDGSAVWAGRITPNKAPHLALQAAGRAGIDLTLFGAIEDADYFRDHIRPQLRGGLRYGGHLPARELAAEYGRASALLFTPQWDEPFGLTAIEAMACGTPVAAIRMGAVDEVVGPAGRYAAADGTGLDQALIEAMQIPRSLPRARVEAHFTLDRMIEGYTRLYRRAIAARDTPKPDIRYPEIELPAMLWSPAPLSAAGR